MCDGAQQDAHELLVRLLEALPQSARCGLGSSCDPHSARARLLFRAVSVHSTRCQECEEVSTHEEAGEGGKVMPARADRSNHSVRPVAECGGECFYQLPPVQPIVSECCSCSLTSTQPPPPCADPAAGRSRQVRMSSVPHLRRGGAMDELFAPLPAISHDPPHAARALYQHPDHSLRPHLHRQASTAREVSSPLKVAAVSVTREAVGARRGRTSCLQ
eukprot:763138-Hanusia_phi.AAC.2